MSTHRSLGLTLAGFAAVALLGASSGSFGLLPFGLILLACPLMMFFMMRGMGGMGHGRDTASHDDENHADAVHRDGRDSDRPAQSADRER